jgi:transcription elongation factor Elf1
MPKPRAKKKQTETCPYCGVPYDPDLDQILECPECGKEGSTACCLSGGVGCPCVECETGEDTGEED